MPSVSGGPCQLPRNEGNSPQCCGCWWARPASILLDCHLSLWPRIGAEGCSRPHQDSSCINAVCAALPLRAAAAQAMWLSTTAAPLSQVPVVSTTMGKDNCLGFAALCRVQTETPWKQQTWAPLFRAKASTLCPTGQAQHCGAVHGEMTLLAVKTSNVAPRVCSSFRNAQSNAQFSPQTGWLHGVCHRAGRPGKRGCRPRFKIEQLGLQQAGKRPIQQAKCSELCSVQGKAVHLATGH